MNGTYGNRTTNTFRKVNSILYTLNQIFSFVFLGTFLLIGIIFLVGSSGALGGFSDLPPAVQDWISRHFSTSDLDVAVQAFFLTFGITFTLLALLLFLPMGIVAGVLRKHNNEPTNRQFIALAIVSGIFSFYIEMAFSIVIYIFESRNERRTIKDGEVK